MATLKGIEAVLTAAYKEANGDVHTKVRTEQVVARVNSIMPTIRMSEFQVLDELGRLDALGMVTNSLGGSVALTTIGKSFVEGQGFLNIWTEFENWIKRHS